MQRRCLVNVERSMHPKGKNDNFKRERTIKLYSNFSLKRNKNLSKYLPECAYAKVFDLRNQNLKSANKK